MPDRQEPARAGDQPGNAIPVDPRAVDAGDIDVLAGTARIPVALPPDPDEDDLEDEPSPATLTAGAPSGREPDRRAAPSPSTEVPVTAAVTLAARRAEEREAERETSEMLTAESVLGVGAPERAGAPWSRIGDVLGFGRWSARARADAALQGRIRARLDGGPRFVATVSRKGGVGKTIVTALLGMALADARDDRVIALDANPDRGTLAERVGEMTAHTARDVSRARVPVHGFSEVSALVTRDETRLDVIASDPDPRVTDAFGDADYREVAALAAHYYSLVLTDTGAGIVHSVMDAALPAADGLLVVSGLSLDEARLASETLTWLEENGYRELARNAVVVLNASRPGAPLVDVARLREHFGSRVRAVVTVPYDPLIAAGGVIDYPRLRAATRRAARELAAVTVDGLRAAPPAA
jgi:MinD-like ATPase involved in chromosome partitioning or flagellar assembly